jgi:hypothetical protein
MGHVSDANSASTMVNSTRQKNLFFHSLNGILTEYEMDRLKILLKLTTLDSTINDEIKEDFYLSFTDSSS